MEPLNLYDWGLTERFAQEASFYQGLYLARVTQQHRGLYQVVSEGGLLFARVSGRLAHDTCRNDDFPAVGDWVMIDRLEDGGGDAVIHQLLRRKTVFERRAAGSSGEAQVVAANIDLVFLCMAFGSDFNLRRLERYLTIAWNSGAQPVILLTKADQAQDLPGQVALVEQVGLGCPVVVCSNRSKEGYSQVLPLIGPGRTVALMGSSGVGKSTLINFLLGEEVLATKEVREDGKGRHTTTHRQLMVLPQGGVVIDTPGMREIQIETGELSKTFADIEGLAQNCRFGDCTHTGEPGCAVLQAVAEGTLSPQRLASYRKLQNEMGYEGMNFRQREEAKLNRMFGSKGEMKQLIRQVKEKNKRR